MNQYSIKRHYRRLAGDADFRSVDALAKAIDPAWTGAAYLGKRLVRRSAILDMKLSRVLALIAARKLWHAEEVEWTDVVKRKTVKRKGKS